MLRPVPRWATLAVLTAVVVILAGFVHVGRTPIIVICRKESWGFKDTFEPRRCIAQLFETMVER